MIDTKENIYEADYIIYFSRTPRYNVYKEEIQDLGDIIFENKYGGIIECYK